MRRLAASRAGWLAAALLLAALAGCGGPDLGGASRGGLDSGLSGNYGGYGGYGGGYGGYGAAGVGANRQGSALVSGRGTYARMEASFEISDLHGNPFDYTENDVVVTFQRPDNQTVRVPAFFDGGKTWRVRYTPDALGRYTISRVSLNGNEIQPEKLEKRDFEATGSPQPGFVRRDQRDHSRFVFDNGSVYYPVGHNVAWGDQIQGDLDKMGKAGENWSRIWMCHWSGLNLDWVADKKLPLGTLDLDVAKKWDSIVEAAEKDGVRFQMVLQHHGQYSTTTNPNWAENPWNKKNGGWLSTPDEFFGDSRAAALTRAKYRYIIARWGYSPAIMAWELFNEVQWTDAIVHQHADEVSAWHNAMAAFLRQQDPYKHLVTSSMGIDKTVFGTTLDYWQLHGYPPDVLSTVTSLDTRKLDRPAFFGEVGPQGGEATDDGTVLKRALWGSIMSDAGGAAEYWSWDVVDKKDLYPLLGSAAAFVRQSGVAAKRNLMPAPVGVEAGDRGALVFGPGGGFEGSKQTEYTVLPSGAVEGIGTMPAFLQGDAHRALFPSLTFKVNYPAAGTFAVTVGQSARGGAHLVVSVDGARGAEKDFASGSEDKRVDETLEVKVPAGEHAIKLENTGADWVVLSRFALAPYAPGLGVVGKSTKDYAAIWVYRRQAASGASTDKATTGKLTLAGMQPGEYRATWWDTQAGKALNEELVAVAKDGTLALTTPSITGDAAVFVEKRGGQSARAAAKPAPKPKRRG